MNATDQAPIVVVGAGVIGLSTALHLRKALPGRRVVVLNAGAVGDGTTPAGAGFVAPWATVLPHLGAPGVALADYSIDFYRKIAATSGQDLRLRQNGNLVLFNRRESMDAAVEALAESEWSSPDNQIIDAREVGRLTSGAVRTDRVAGAVFMPRGMQFETGVMLSELADIARAREIEIKEGHEVTAVQVADGRIAGVAARRDDRTRVTIASDLVVLAVGAWLNDLLEPVGWTLPLLPFVATRFVTDDLGIASTMPTIQAKDFPLWIREAEGGFTWGSTAGAAPAHRMRQNWTRQSPTRRRDDQLVANMTADAERISEVFPALAHATTISVIQGMPVYTVDRQFFAGSVPGCSGLWAVGGDNESGVSHGPGLGRLMSDLISGAPHPLCDASGYRLDRLSPSQFPTAEAVGQDFVRQGPSFIADAMT
jgi:sarcosine oxidase subunit beta